MSRVKCQIDVSQFHTRILGGELPVGFCSVSDWAAAVAKEIRGDPVCVEAQQTIMSPRDGKCNSKHDYTQSRAGYSIWSVNRPYNLTADCRGYEAALGGRSDPGLHSLFESDSVCTRVSADGVLDSSVLGVLDCPKLAD